MSAPRAVCLVSGGMDSAVALAIARAEGRACYALSVDYGQRHAVELACAARVARALGAVEHRVVALDLRARDGSALGNSALGGSALTSDAAVPKDRAHAAIGR
ncbi:MAG: 7-cyano-7-deazaguanine synthase, partial [Planctomycetota bacterium]